MMKLLIGYDGSDGANQAINDLRRAGLPERGVEARVVCIADLWLNTPGETYAKAFPEGAAEIALRVDRELEQARHWADEGAQRVVARFPGWQVTGEAAADSPYWGLITRAETWKADLICLGSQGRSAIGRLFLGSVSHNVALYAPCGVRIGRHRAGREAPGQPQRVLIGWDGSSGADAAVNSVAAREWSRGSEFRLVTAEDLQFTTLYPGTFPEAIPWSLPTAGQAVGTIVSRHELMRSQAQAAIERLRVKGLAVKDLVIREGSPKQVLLDEAEQWNADCIFVGARGLSRMKRVLLGSVSAAVVARAHCSVEVVR